MYEWKKLSLAEQQSVLEARKERGFPFHVPPHISSKSNIFHISAACYEHRHIINTALRLDEFSQDLIDFCEENNFNLYAWAVLTNHYHLLIEFDELEEFIRLQGQFHGRLSYQWNKEDSLKGRKVFYRQSDRYIRSERHFWVTMNYIHNNPVHHDYVKKWQDWPYSSAIDFLEKNGREEVLRIWEEYPLKDYGKKWDV